MKKFVDHCLAQFVQPESLILKEWVGMAASSTSRGNRGGSKKRFCLFAHFDRDGKIDSYVEFYLKSLASMGVDILFISTSENLIEAEIEKITPYCIHLIQRKNIGLDFGSWKIGWIRAQSFFHLTENYDQLILANDSVYGPFFPLLDIFDSMEKRELDLWGISSSRELADHLQSFFLIFEKRALKSEGLKEFWDRLLFYRSKARIIQEYEIGLTQWAHKQGWKLGAFVEFDENRHKGVNSTLFSWDSLIEQDRFPFLKTEVLKLNRAQSPRIGEWPEILKARSPYPVDLIQRHLARFQ